MVFRIIPVRRDVKYYTLYFQRSEGIILPNAAKDYVTTQGETHFREGLWEM